MSNSQIVDRTTFECFQASLPLHMACMVLGSSLPHRNSKKETVTDYISVVTAVGQPPTANRTPSAVTANPGRVLAGSALRCCWHFRWVVQLVSTIAKALPHVPWLTVLKVRLARNRAADVEAVVQQRVRLAVALHQPA